MACSYFIPPPLRILLRSYTGCHIKNVKFSAAVLLWNTAYFITLLWCNFCQFPTEPLARFTTRDFHKFFRQFRKALRSRKDPEEVETLVKWRQIEVSVKDLGDFASRWGRGAAMFSCYFSWFDTKSRKSAESATHFWPTFLMEFCSPAKCISRYQNPLSFWQRSLATETNCKVWQQQSTNEGILWFQSQGDPFCYFAQTQLIWKTFRLSCWQAWESLSDNTFSIVFRQCVLSRNDCRVEWTGFIARKYFETDQRKCKSG